MKDFFEYGKSYKRNDSYIREDIKELFDDYGEIALIFTCKYIVKNLKYVTLGNVRVFDDALSRKTKYQLTDHVNLPCTLVEEYIELNEEEHKNKKLFMVCTPSQYDHYGVERYALRLVTGYSIAPIIRASTVKSQWEKDLAELRKLRDYYNANREYNIGSE